MADAKVSGGMLDSIWPTRKVLGGMLDKPIDAEGVGGSVANSAGRRGRMCGPSRRLCRGQSGGCAGRRGGCDGGGRRGEEAGEAGYIQPLLVGLDPRKLSIFRSVGSIVLQEETTNPK